MLCGETVADCSLRARALLQEQKTKAPAARKGKYLPWQSLKLTARTAATGMTETLCGLLRDHKTFVAASDQELNDMAGKIEIRPIRTFKDVFHYSCKH